MPTIAPITTVLASTIPTLQRKIMDRTKRDPVTSCWTWTLTLTPEGYARMCVMVSLGHRRSTGVHRVSWIVFRGPIPDGFEIDHLCFNIACVNPDHLEPVPGVENRRRARAAIERGAGAGRPWPTCIRGHDRRPENLYVYTAKNGEMIRECRVCTKENKLRWELKNRPAADSR